MLKLPETDTHFRSLKKANGYQRNALFHALAFVNKWNCAIDIGAHVGYITTVLAPLFEQVHAFEPHPENFDCLLENSPPNVSAYCQALGAGVGRGGLASPLVSNSGAWQFVDDPTGRVVCMPLDAHDLAPDFMKLDVQGMELDVIKGGRETIAKHHPVLLIETMMDGHESKEIFELMSEMDYDFSIKIGKNTVFVWKPRVAI